MRDSSEQTEFRNALVALPALKSVLEDLSVRHAIVGPNGRWSYEKLGRTRNDQPLLELEALNKVSDIVRLRGLTRFGEWSVKTYRGKNGDLLLFERLPIPVADRLPQPILAGLKKQVRVDGDGVVIGPTGSGKSSLLCWLALQIPDEDVLLVSENPPNELPGQHVQHVYPPTSELKRRGFERLIRLSTVVFWDRVSSGEDMATLLASTRAKRRWFTLDSSDFYDALNLLVAWSRTGITPSLATVFAVSRSGIGRTEPTTFLTHDGESWIEKHRPDGEYAQAMTEFDEGVSRTAKRLSAPHRAIRQESRQELTVQLDDAVVTGDRTGMISIDSLEALKGAALRSQEMDGVAEVTKHYIESPSNEFAVSQEDLDGNSTPLPKKEYEKVARASGQFDLVEKPDIPIMGHPSVDDTGEDLNLENLRVTRSEIITESDLFHISSSDIESLSGDFSSVVDADELQDISELLSAEPDEATNPDQAILDQQQHDETRMQRVSREMISPAYQPPNNNDDATRVATISGQHAAAEPTQQNVAVDGKRVIVNHQMGAKNMAEQAQKMAVAEQAQKMGVAEQAKKTGPHLVVREEEFGMTEELTFGEKLEMLRKRRHDS